MSSENDTAPAAEAAKSDFDWSQVTGGADTPAPAPRAAGAAPAAFNNLPPTPPQTGIIVGRLPIKGDTGKAVIQLPEAVKAVHCAFSVSNTGVLSDCYRPAKNACVPNALRTRPLNDREFEVILDGGDGVVKGQGWKTGDYPGSVPTTRSIGTGVPYVEVMALVGIDCGCDSDDWVGDNEWGQ